MTAVLWVFHVTVGLVALVVIPLTFVAVILGYEVLLGGACR